MKTLRLAVGTVSPAPAEGGRSAAGAVAVPLVVAFAGAMSAPVAGVLLTAQELQLDGILGATGPRRDLVVFLVLALLDAAPFTRTAWAHPLWRAAVAVFVGSRMGVHLAAGELAAPGFVGLSGCVLWFGLTAARGRR